MASLSNIPALSALIGPFTFTKTCLPPIRNDQTADAGIRLKVRQECCARSEGRDGWPRRAIYLGLAQMICLRSTILRATSVEFVEVACPQCNVHIFPNEIDQTICYQEIKRDVRIARQELRQCRTKMVRRQEWERMYSQMTTRRASCRSNFGFRGLDGIENLARAFEICFALGRQCQTPRRSIDKSHAESLLQSRD